MGAGKTSSAIIALLAVAVGVVTVESLIGVSRLFAVVSGWSEMTKLMTAARAITHEISSNNCKAPRHILDWLDSSK